MLEQKCFDCFISIRGATTPTLTLILVRSNIHFQKAVAIRGIKNDYPSTRHAAPLPVSTLPYHSFVWFLDGSHHTLGICAVHPFGLPFPQHKKTWGALWPFISLHSFPFHKAFIRQGAPNGPDQPTCFAWRICGNLMEEREVWSTPGKIFHALSSSLAGGLHCRCDGSDRRWEAYCFFINKSVQPPVSKPSFNLALMMISLIRLPKANDRNCAGCDTEDQNNITVEAYRRNQHFRFWA